MIGRRPGRALVALAAVIAVSGCGPDGAEVHSAPATDQPAPDQPPIDGSGPADRSPVTYPANGETVEVRALDNSFRPETLEIVAGSEVLWVNGGRNEHDVLPVDDALTWGVGVEDFVPGDEYRLVFDTPGVFAYYCSIHGTKEVGMVGTVVVSAPGP